MRRVLVRNAAELGARPNSVRLDLFNVNCESKLVLKATCASQSLSLGATIVSIWGQI